MSTPIPRPAARCVSDANCLVVDTDSAGPGFVALTSTEREGRLILSVAEWQGHLDAHRRQVLDEVAEHLRLLVEQRASWLWFELGESALLKVADRIQALAGPTPAAGLSASLGPEQGAVVAPEAGEAQGGSQGIAPDPALVGPWVATLSDPSGFLIDLDDLVNWDDAWEDLQVSVVRGSAAPVDDYGAQRMPARWDPADVLYRVDDFDEESEVRLAWQRAQAVAQALNARASVPADQDPMPVFVIKAKDKLAVLAVREYRQLCIDRGLDDQADEVDKALVEIEEWRDRHRDLVALPDHKHVPAGGDR